MYIRQWIGPYYIEASNRSRHKWSHFKIHGQRGHSAFHRHLVWGPISIVVSQPQFETVTVCSECDGRTEMEHVSSGDECWSVCPNCRTIEGNTHEISLWDFERLS